MGTGTAPNGSRRSVSTLAGELRELVALRSRSAVRDRVLPALDDLLKDDERDDRERRFAARQHLLDSAIDAMTDPAHRSAARELLGSGPNRWQPLTRRGPKAASAFHLGWDAYRRRREATGASLLDDTLDALAATLIDPHRAVTDTPLRSEPEVVIPPSTTTEPTPPAERTAGATPASASASAAATRSPTTVAAIVGGVLVLALLALVVIDRRSRSEGDSAAVSTPVRCGQLTASAGATAPDAGPEVRRWSASFRAAAADAPEGATRCAGTMHIDQGVPIQVTTAGDGSAPSAIVGTPDDGRAIWLSAGEYQAFQEFTLKSINPERTLGRPIQRINRTDGSRVVQFEDGLTYQQAEAAPVRAVMGSMYDEWERRGGLEGPLGPPLTNDYYFQHDPTRNGIIQDFLHGRLNRTYERDASYTVLDYTTEDRTPPPSNPAIVVAHPRTSSWFVANGERRWIANWDDLHCTAAAHGLEPVDLPMIAIQDLPIGERMEPCR